MAVNDREFVRRAAYLARSSGTEWSAFVTEFRKIAGQKLMQCIEVSNDMMLVAKGNALAYQDLLETFENCVTMAEKIEAKHQR